MPYPLVDLSRVRTYPLVKRENLVALQNLVTPDLPAPKFEQAELPEVVERLVAARRQGRPVMWMMGGHVIKRGLAPVLIDLMERGLITHLASNGSATIHDFEIALMGQTSEDVLASLADGSFGMAEETGAWMNQAIRSGARDGLGLGEALGRKMAQDERFLYRSSSLLYNAYRLGIPYTVHVAIGTDIIHQHPLVDFAALGWASGQDFKIFTAAVCDLEGGVFCNFGSAVIGPEVFLKALSIARNLGHPVRVFTTANFDLIPLADYRSPLKDDVTDYYYRPRKNIVNRPVALGGKGFHICGDHRLTIPNIHHMLVARLERAPLPAANSAIGIEILPDPVRSLLDTAMAQAVGLEDCRASLGMAYRLMQRCLSTSGCVWVCAGGDDRDEAHADARAFQHKLARLPLKPLPEAHLKRLASLEGGAAMAQTLKPGLRVRLLGEFTADRQAEIDPVMVQAQELYTQARAGDSLLVMAGRDVDQGALQAAIAASAMGLAVIALAGCGNTELNHLADVSIQVPGETENTARMTLAGLIQILADILAGD